MVYLLRDTQETSVARRSASCRIFSGFFGPLIIYRVSFFFGFHDDEECDINVGKKNILSCVLFDLVFLAFLSQENKNKQKSVDWANIRVFRTTFCVD